MAARTPHRFLCCRVGGGGGVSKRGLHGPFCYRDGYRGGGTHRLLVGKCKKANQNSHAREDRFAECFRVYRRSYFRGDAAAWVLIFQIVPPGLPFLDRKSVV